MNDLKISRSFGISGSIHYVLVAASCFLTVKGWNEIPVNRSLASQLAKNNGYFGITKEEFEAKTKRQYELMDRQINISAAGSIFWGLGLLSSFFRSLWSPRS